MTKKEAVKFAVDLIHNLGRNAHDNLYELWDNLDCMSARCLDKPMEADSIKEAICELILPGFKCSMCGKGRMVTETIADHHTQLGGKPVRVKDAQIAFCDHCKDYCVSAKELERWDKIQEEQ